MNFVACLKAGILSLLFSAGIGGNLLPVIQVSSALAQSATQTGASGRPIPRFVSLKSSEVNLRKGPGTDYPTAWVFRRAGLPVEIVQEHEAWRKVRDAEGTTGWVLGWLLSKRRTAQILPWDAKAGQDRPKVAIRENDSSRSKALALIEAGVIANVHTCDSRWCLVTIGDFRGYIEQPNLWGVYEGETVK